MNLWDFPMDLLNRHIEYSRDAQTFRLLREQKPWRKEKRKDTGTPFIVWAALIDRSL